MDIFLEILNGCAALATVAGLLLEVWREYKQRRMTKGEKERTGGHRS
jgi:hypothetical protein